MRRGDARIVPASIADARGQAFAAVMAKALDEPSFEKLLFERIDTVDAAVLPFLIRDFSIEEFVEPGMREDVIRRLLKEAFRLHQMKASIAGVRHGLRMLGMRVSWRQWFEMTPPGPPGTHELTVFLNEYIFDNQNAILDARAQRAAARMILGMKRWSQTETLRIGVAIAGRLTAAVAGQALQMGRTDAKAKTPRKGRSAIVVAAAAQALHIGTSAGRACTPRHGHASVAAAAAAQAMALAVFSGRASHRSLR